MWDAIQTVILAYPGWTMFCVILLIVAVADRITDGKLL